jgi:hypothetical protein
MRKYRYLAVAAAGVMVLAAPAAAFASSHSSKPVLTVGKVGGKALSKGAKLGASLVKKTDVTFSIGAFASTCTSSSFASKVVANPATKGAAKGKAELSVTSEKLGGCVLHTTISGLSLKSITAVGLPYSATISAKGAVSITPGSKTSPMGFEATIMFGTTPLTCVFTATSTSGKAANKANTVAFKDQKFTLNDTLTPSADLTLCKTPGTTSTFTATYGPVKSKGKAVFVG